MNIDYTNRELCCLSQSLLCHLPCGRGVAAAAGTGNGLLGTVGSTWMVVVVGGAGVAAAATAPAAEAVWGRRVIPICASGCTVGAAAAGAGLLGGLTGTEGTGLAAGDVAAGISYFCNCSKYVSAVGTEPQLTSSELVLARTSCTREGDGGFSAKEQDRN